MRRLFTINTLYLTYIYNTLNYLFPAQTAVGCWLKSDLLLDLECDVSQGPITILTGILAVSSCVTDGQPCCNKLSDCQVPTPQERLDTLSTACDGQYQCSILVTQQLFNCGGFANYEEVSYQCGTVLTTGMLLKSSLNAGSYILALCAIQSN